MKAVVQTEYGSPEVLSLQEIQKPVPGENEVLIRIHATTVESTDALFRSGRDMSARMATGIRKPKHQTPGSEFAGEIEAIGEAVTRFKPGDRVFGTAAPNVGAHAEYICLPQDGAIAFKPSQLSYEEAVAVHPGALTALPNLIGAANLQRGQRILIIGASGSIGSSAVQLAKHLGAHVTGVCSTANVDLVKSLGADEVIDYRQQDFTQGEARYDVIFDSVGKSSFAKASRVLKHGGLFLTTVVSPVILGQMLWTSRFGSRKAMIVFAGLRPNEEKQGYLALLLELIAAGKFRPVIDRIYPFAQITEAHRYVDTGRKKGSVVVTVANGSH